MKDGGFMKNSVWLSVCLMIAGFLMTACTGRENSAPLACISLTVADDNFMQMVGEYLVDSLEEKGYRTQVVFCDNDISKQIKQIYSFTASGAEIIAVGFAGNSDAYEEALAAAKEKGCKVMGLCVSKEVKYCDVQDKNYYIQKGLQMSILLKEFLDREYPDAKPKEVTALLLEMTNKDDLIQFSAGYRMVAEKYLRYFDSSQVDFIREENGETVYYLDDGGIEMPVEEPAGGLILDEEGYAQRNPYYDERINLCFSPNRNVNSDLDGQNAVDTFMASPQGYGLRIVISFSGTAAVGAAERLMYYYQTGFLDTEPEKLAVFGSDNTEINRELVLKSVKNESLLRGYVGGSDVSEKIHTMLDMLLEGNGEHFLTVHGFRSQITEDKKDVEVIFSNAAMWEDPDMFFKMDRRE